MGKIRNILSRYFGSRQSHVLTYGGFVPFEWQGARYKFGRCIFQNITELLTDIYSEVTWTALPGYDTQKFRAWRLFVDYNGQRILGQLYKTGFAVIGWSVGIEGDVSFRQLKVEEYEVESSDENTYIRVKTPDIQYYIIKSPTFEATGKSDYQLCKPFMIYLDNVLNSSNTVSERMGVFVAASPRDPANAPMPTALDPEEKKEIERQMQNEYGSLRRQNIAMILPRPMDFQTVNLAGLDLKTNDKARLAILAIADRVKVPANQIAIIDANSSKSLSNGTELREGDLAKYRSFRRLLNATLYDFAVEIGLRVDYTIENEPRTMQGQTIEQV